MHFTKSFLISVLRQLDREHGASVLTVINVRPGDLFAMSSLGPCDDCGLRGIDCGQDRDCRYSTDGPEGLHAHVYPDRIAFHLDAVQWIKNWHPPVSGVSWTAIRSATHLRIHETAHAIHQALA